MILHLPVFYLFLLLLCPEVDNAFSHSLRNLGSYLDHMHCVKKKKRYARKIAQNHQSHVKDSYSFISVQDVLSRISYMDSDNYMARHTQQTLNR